jgi:superfamily I DNA/RNA helicase
MEYEVTPERQVYLDARGHTILTACPGSGKTTSIVKKLWALSHYCAECYGKHTGFACLSFTNKACDELKDRYRDMHDERLSFPNEVATIDSFIMQKVVLPFWYLCGACKKKPTVINEEEILERIHYHNVQISGQWQQYPVYELRPYARLMHSKKPSLISRDKTVYKWDHKIVTKENEKAYCQTVFNYRLAKGYITSSDALWIACNIMENHQDVAQALVTRYPYIIVDEAQDNSELHFEFFDLLKRAGLQNLEFVGDICQSIYGFNNAQPKLLQDRIESGDWNVLPLSECRRSNQRIIDLYSKLKSSIVPAIVAHNVEDAGIPIVVYKYDDSNVREIIRDFYQTCDDNGLKSKMILARGTTKCKSLAGVKDTQFRFWKTEVPYLLINAVFDAENGDLNAAFRKVRLVLAELKFKDNAEERRKFILSIENDVDVNTKIFKFLQVIPPFNLCFREWTEQVTSLLKQWWNLEERPLFETYVRKTDNQGRGMRVIAELPIEQYYQSNDEGSNYHKSVDTIHGVKGTSLDGVLLFLSEDSQGQRISLKEFPRRPVMEMTEKQRLIYVACSRARQFLALAVPRTLADEEITRALSGAEITIRRINLQGELAFE